MRNISTNSADKATVCYRSACVTVHGSAAQVLTGIVLVATFVMAVSAIAKALR